MNIWRHVPLVILIGGWLSLVLVSVPLHETVHVYNCEYFGGTIIEKGFSYVRCDADNIYKIGRDHYSRYIMMDALNELVTYTFFLFMGFVVNIMVFVYLIWGGENNGSTKIRSTT